MRKTNESYLKVNEQEVLVEDIKHCILDGRYKEIETHLDAIKKIIYKCNTSEDKDVFSKEYNELTIEDKDKIIEALELDTNTSMYKAKEDFIISMCKHREDEEYFNVKGKTIPKLVCEIDISKIFTSKESLAYVMSNLEHMRIKPRCVFVCDGWATLDFHPREYYHFNQWGDYIRTVIKFIEYLEELRELGINLTYREPFEPGLARDIDKSSRTTNGSIFTEELFNHNAIELYGEIVGELKY